MVAPQGTVPKRNALPYDAFGGYITVKTNDSAIYSGELIGMRNDTMMVLADSMKYINPKNISKARIVICSPNQYGKGFFLALPNLFLLGLSNEYGGGPAGLAIGLTVIDAIGVSIAKGTENKRINYYDWSEGWTEVMKYSRFPSGVPSNIKLSELRSRPLKSAK